MFHARFVQGVRWCDIGETVNHGSGFGLSCRPIWAAVVAVYFDQGISLIGSILQ